MNPKSKILIVDDIVANRILLSEIVESLGFEYAEACNGKEALKKIIEGNFVVVLMDIEMPIMNGIEAVKAIKSNYKTSHTKVVGVTAHDPKTFFSDYKGAGFDGFVTKPYTLNRIKECISEQMI